MPAEISGQSVSRMVIGDRQVLDFQALLVEIEGGLYLIDNGGQTYVNQQQIIGQERLNSGDRIRIGNTELQLQIMMMDAPTSSPGQRYNHLRAVPDPALEPSPSLNGNGNYHGNGNHQGNPATKLDSSANQGNIHGINNIPDLVHNSGHQPNDPAISPHGNGAGHLPAIEPQPAASPSPVARSKETQAPALTPPAPIPSPAATPQPMQLQSSQPNSGCRRSVGFLFKRPCGRKSSSGCDQCANGYSNHAYSADYDLYEGYGRFEPGDWGYGLLEKHSQQ